MSYEFYDNEAGYASAIEIGDEILDKIRARKIGKATLLIVK